MKKYIEIYKARQNNLKNLNVKIPLGSLTLVCGLSGSGKSSLAFETLYAEGQRRYLQNLSNYLKQYIIQQNPPDVEQISNLPAALALEQKNNVKSPRSTVASFSGLADHLRLIFEKRAKVYCPRHRIPLKSFSPEEIGDFLLKNFLNQRAFLLREIVRSEISSTKIFFKQLKAKGFKRLLIPQGKTLSLDQIKNIENIKTLPKKNFYLLLDRFVIDVKRKSRLQDSLYQAYYLPQMFSFGLGVFSEEVLVQIVNGEKRAFSKKAQCPECDYQFSLPLKASLFSFNSPLGACPDCEGYGYKLEIDEDKVIKARLSLKKGAVLPFENPSATSWKARFKKFCEKKNIPWNKPWCNFSLRQRRVVWEDKGGLNDYFQMLEHKKYKMHIRILLSRYKSIFTCKTCKGFKLRNELDRVLFKGKNFNDYMKMTLGQMKNFFDNKDLLSQEKIGLEESFKALLKHLKYLNALGLSYIGLNRSVSTLSGGEFQRLNLSSQLGLCLSQVLYVLDEPTVGLHPRDTARMIELLEELKNLGNTIVIVEHEREVMKHCDYVIELGPESGQKGGALLFSGPAKDFSKSLQSNTASYLKDKKITLKTPRPVNKNTYKYQLCLTKSSGHNLKNVDLFLPLNRFVVLTGLSGSGKSSLAVNTLYPALKKELEGEKVPGLHYKELIGAEFLKNVVLMDQSSMRKSSRSTVISYIKAFDIIRHNFSQSPLAKRQNFKSSHFSLNIEGGRCSSCRGLGYQEIDMVFMDPLKITCEDCKGEKFKSEILEVSLDGKNIMEVLKMTVKEAFDFFKTEASLLRAFNALQSVGLSYLSLGQSLSSLSGGERQRLKLSRELLNSSQDKTLYILDEPSKGLHFKELELLLQVIDRLVESGGSFLVIEHNQDIIKEADYIIDMGPGAGSQGGKIIFEGSPQQILSCEKSYTGQFLDQYINNKKP